ncbi:S-layer homology domain-containing protein [Paenibacillus sp. FA6]|uniref:S-layer homology domain-containing protein n=1 Tax=Paenibacillus sp. FA6 TaxID=3413029 RepID=UPI003F65B7E6
MGSRCYNNIISGYTDGTFKPNAQITRAEIISIISKIVNLSSVSGNASTTFTDTDKAWNKD